MMEPNLSPAAHWLHPGVMFPDDVVGRSAGCGGRTAARRLGLIVRCVDPLTGWLMALPPNIVCFGYKVVVDGPERSAPIRYAPNSTGMQPTGLHTPSHAVSNCAVSRSMPNGEADRWSTILYQRI
jgi:hypothetical protein